MHGEPVFTPSQYIGYLAKRLGLKKSDLKIPRRMTMVYDQDKMRFLRNLTGGNAVRWWYSGQRPLQVGRYKRKPIASICNLIGAPAACMILEEAIAAGAKEIVEVGIAGGIQPHLKPGDILVVTSGERDEGTSFHYYPPRYGVRE
jgi:nucleoside phosphorylase